MFKFMNIFVQSIVFCCIFATSGFAQDYKFHQIVSDFECGDLLYGLQKPARAWYLSTIEQKICKTDNPFHYTEELAKTEPSSYMGSVPCMPKPNFPPKRIVYCTADVYNKKLHSSEDTKTQLDEDYANYMKARMKAKDLGQFDSEDENDELKFLCKNAIGFTIAQGKKVRFLLDGLNMGVISSKERRLGLSFTSVELRYVYRHWEEFKGHVVFYERGQRLEAAPWENDPKLWETYGSYREYKQNHPGETWETYREYFEYMKEYPQGTWEAYDAHRRDMANRRKQAKVRSAPAAGFDATATPSRSVVRKLF
ncbi:MAG: hypothetical protein KF798_03345 [Candidatus Paracaedibacteraceae bacterium]|nr:hypothetical protein [Candidatus Paracaedibacteraceae bacterium]